MNEQAMVSRVRARAVDAATCLKEVGYGGG